jgi:hypothetical protein
LGLNLVSSVEWFKIASALVVSRLFYDGEANKPLGLKAMLRVSIVEDIGDERKK